MDKIKSSIFLIIIVNIITALILVIATVAAEIGIYEPPEKGISYLKAFLYINPIVILSIIFTYLVVMPLHKLFFEYD